MSHRASAVVAAALLLLAPVASQAALTSYSQNFESLSLADPAALSANGWVVYGNVFNPTHTTFLYGYGVFPAPNPGGGFCAIAAGEGGPLQGAQQLSIYSDYNNTDHAAGNQIESNVFVEQTIAAGDVNRTWTFQFDAKLGNLVAPSTALAFIKTINPAQGYAMTNLFTVNTTAIPTTWNTYSISITLDPLLAGQLLQFGFSNTASNYLSSGVFYDNITFLETVQTGVAPRGPGGLALAPAAPNPFQGSTSLEYSLPQSADADISVYDVGGRRIAQLFHGLANAGPHVAVWDGRLSDGRLAPVGIYRAVLQTAAGRTSRSLVLSR